MIVGWKMHVLIFRSVRHLTYLSTLSFASFWFTFRRDASKSFRNGS